MERIFIKDIKLYIGKEVEIAGWVDSRRSHGKLIFSDIRDGSGVVQTVSNPQKNKGHALVGTMRDEWVVVMRGIVTKRPENMVNPEIPLGDLEFSVLETKILAEAAEMPFEKNADLNIDTYLDFLPLTLRREKSRAIFKVQTTIIQSYRQFLTHEGFMEFQAPKLIGDDAEGSGEVFEVPYFNEKTAHLATSPQLYKQIMVGVFGRVFTTGNVFRAERHATTRHLNEYTSLDVEMGFIDSHKDIMRVLTKLMRFIAQELHRACAYECGLLGASIPEVPDEIPALKLREAQELIKKETGRDSTKEPDLAPEDERWLCEYSAQKRHSDFIFITHYPVSKRPFYTYEDSEDPGYTKSFDLLFRGVEITTGGQRRNTYESMLEGLKIKNLKPEAFSYYLEAFKYGMPPHGGWGMGLERLTAKFLNLDNIKEATLFPRDINRIDTRLTSSDN